MKQACLVNGPHSVYRNHPIPKQIPSYNFWLYSNSAGAKGQNSHKNCSSVNHRRSSQYLIDNIKRNSWPRFGKVRRVTLLMLLFLAGLFSNKHSSFSLLEGYGNSGTTSVEQKNQTSGSIWRTLASNSRCNSCNSNSNSNNRRSCSSASGAEEEE